MASDVPMIPLLFKWISHRGKRSEPLFLNGEDADREKWGGRPDSMGEMGG